MKVGIIFIFIVVYVHSEVFVNSRIENIHLKRGEVLDYSISDDLFGNSLKTRLLIKKNSNNWVKLSYWSPTYIAETVGKYADNEYSYHMNVVGRRLGFTNGREYISVDITDIQNPTTNRSLYYCPGKCIFGSISDIGYSTDLRYLYFHEGSNLRYAELDVGCCSCIPLVRCYFLSDVSSRYSKTFGDHMYLAGDSAGYIKVLNVADGLNPAVVDTLNGDEPEKLDIYGNYLAYTDSSAKKMCLVDISNPNSVERKGCVTTGLLSPQDVSIHENYAFVADDSQGVKVINITDKMNPEQVSYYDTIKATSIFYQDDRVYVGDIPSPGDGDPAVLVLDVSDKKKPKYLWRQEFDYGVKEFQFEYNYMYMLFYGSSKGRVKIYKMSMKLQGSSDFDELFCGSTDITLIGQDGNDPTKSVSHTVTITREDWCSGHGDCLKNNMCDCFRGYSGTICGEWECYGIENKDSKSVCSGHGFCTDTDTCECESTWYGDKCSKSTLYLTVMTPGLVVLSFGGVCCIMFIYLLLCGCCCACVIFFLFSFCSCSGVAINQTKHLNYYGKLKNFELYLKEQELNEDTSIAHLRITQTLFEIPIDEIEISKVLGEGGSSSVVYKSTWKGQTVAFKCFKTRHVCDSQDHFDEFEKEVHILGSVGHPNILQFLGCCLNPPRIGILMEFCENGDLSYFLRRKIMEKEEENEESYPLEEKMRMCIEISSAMEYLHSRNIIHRDLKLENVLVDGSERTKLMDFGLSRMTDRISQAHNLTKKIGTSIYMAPEVVKYGERYNEKCDVFSFSIMLFIIFSEQFEPYGGNAANIEILVSNNANIRPNLMKLRKTLSSSTQNCGKMGWLDGVIQKCWDADPNERYSFGKLREIFVEKKSKLNEKEGSESSSKYGNDFLKNLFGNQNNEDSTVTNSSSFSQTKSHHHHSTTGSTTPHHTSSHHRSRMAPPIPKSKPKRKKNELDMIFGQQEDETKEDSSEILILEKTKKKEKKERLVKEIGSLEDQIGKKMSQLDSLKKKLETVAPKRSVLFEKKKLRMEDDVLRISKVGSTSKQPPLLPPKRHISNFGGF